MDRRLFLTAAFISVLLTSLMATQHLVHVAYSDTSPTVAFLSPEANQTYNTKNVVLVFIVSGAGSDDPVLYSLDGEVRNQFFGSRTVSETLVGLSEGPHTVEVKITYLETFYTSFGGIGAKPSEKHSSVSFTVESSLPSPLPSIEPSPSTMPSSSVSPISVDEVMQNPSSYLNQTVYVRGWLQSEPLPAPYGIGMNGYGVLYVQWGPDFFIIDSVNASMAVVQGVIKEVTWTNPHINQTEHDYYIDAQAVDFLPTPTPYLPSTPTASEPTLEPTSTITEQTGFLGTNLPIEYGYAIVTVLIIAAVIGVSIVYLKKRGKI